MRTIRVSARRGVVVAALIMIISIGFLAVIVASPWLTRSLVGRPGDWRELSEVGQAYGGISAILSGLAFCGIACSLILQWHQTRLSQSMTARERHFELVKMGLEDPSLIMQTEVPGGDPAMRRKFLVCSLWMAHWAMLWDTRTVDRTELRTLFDEFFVDTDAVTWWSGVQSHGWGRGATSRRRAFLTVAEEAHRVARGRTPAANSKDGVERPQEMKSSSARLGSSPSNAAMYGPSAEV
ncbi:DUF6082 family protein [Actinoplanes friuliensis]|uniref:DUF6082 family protein n=1 Tax=Actinoplanes friuliensis TaxID=196914 RepID=UPI0011DE365F|nr:DUF6082 family protein [Actinoplanes friuliensis]